MEVAFSLWCCGDASKKYPPLRLTLLNAKVHPVAVRKRFSEFKCAMERLEKYLRENQQWIESATEGQATQMFKLLPQCSETTPNGRKRRLNQNKFTSSVRDDRRKKKTNQVSADDVETA